VKTKTKMMKLSDLKVPADAKVNEHLSELLRKAYSGEDAHQAEKVAHLAVLLEEEARKAGKDFGRLHSAVMAFVTALDGTVAQEEDECIGVLGDAEFAHLYLESLKRRGKNDPRYAALLLSHASEMLAAQSSADEASEAINEALAGLTGTVGVN
jgi:hypothetical protein